MKHDYGDIAMLEIREDLTFLERELLEDLKACHKIIERMRPYVREYHLRAERGHSGDTQ